MKILATGVTKQQCGYGTALGYEPVADLFVRALTLAGHEVDHRYTAPGDDLGQYDAVLVGVVPFFSIASNNLYAALDVIRRTEAAGKPLMTFIDDWGFTRLMSNINTHLRYPPEGQLTKPFFKGRLHYDWAVEHTDELMALIQRLQTEDWAPTLIPAFSWGDHAKMGDLLPIISDKVFVDVSPLARSYPVEWLDGRRREWVLGTVSNQTGWLAKLNLGWDTRHLGTKTSRAPEKLLEKDLVQLYAESWGVLSPPYKSILGTGWWRNRVVYAMRTGAILLSDPAEMPQLGDPYTMLPAAIEAMTDSELHELASAQRHAFCTQQPRAIDVVDQVNAALTRAKERVA
jgi:hypothetical protein